jgi:hypothetical protein
MKTETMNPNGQAANDVQAEIIAASTEVPEDIWKAIEAVRPFLPRQTEPVFMTSYTGTSGVL